MPALTLCSLALALTLSRPDYLAPAADPATGVRIVRITDDAGRPVRGLGGRWGADARHVYSKQQAWNADQTLLAVQNRGGDPSIVLLDGRDYRPRGPRCAGGAVWDWRWHPRLPTVMVDVDRGGRTLSWYDVARCMRTRSWSLPVAVDGFG